jgi:hypothetical protein
MKHQLITTTILLIAVALYLAGYSNAGNVGFITGTAFETWFGFEC